MRFEALFRPRSVAVVGASRSPDKVGHAVLSRLLADGFAGEVVPVNPHADEILGLRCHADLREHDGRVDLAVIAVPRDAVEPAVMSALASGVRAVVVVAAGFAETGPEGAHLESRIAERCRLAGVVMLGPNSVGIINTHHRLNASFAARMPGVGGVSVISQSGAVCAAVLDLAVRRDLGLAKLISTGNQAGIGETDLLSALGDDPQTTVIVGYLEGTRAGEDFVRAAARVSARKPVVLLKAGSTAAGARAVAAHTGRSAGGDAAYAAAFRRAGVIRAECFEDLVDYATAFAALALPRGPRVAVVTDSGGMGAIAFDAIERRGLRTAELGRDTIDALAARPAAGDGAAAPRPDPRVPVDVLDDADSDVLGRAVAAVCADDAVDAVLVLLRPVASVDIVRAADAVAVAAAASGKPVLASLLGGDAVRPGRLRLRSLGVPDYPSPERAVRAVAALRDYASWREAPPRVVTRFPVHRRRAERIVERGLEAGGGSLGVIRTRELLAAYDFCLPAGRLALSSDEAIEVAEQVGYPVALKLVSPDTPRRRDVGGVRIGLGSPDAVRDAFELVMAGVRRAAPSARVEGVFVERMASGGTEVVLGMSRDPQFGPLLRFGMAGSLVEALDDLTFRLAPITADEALDMLRGARSFAELERGGTADGPSPDAVAGCLQRLGQLVTDFPVIADVEIEPLIVGPPGAAPVVAGARIALVVAAAP